jgi:hypothetical protein
MTVQFHNYEFSYLGAKGKRIFVPTQIGREIGGELKELIEQRVTFEPLFYHFHPGGHIAALHAHRENEFVAKLDLQNFFYSIARNQVGHALYDAGVSDPGYYARWSTVKNPYAGPSYALPYGFVQSPIAATLVLRGSALGRNILKFATNMTVSVYLDDIAVSGPDEHVVNAALTKLLEAASESKLPVNPNKIAYATPAASLFNCEVQLGHSVVTDARKGEFYARPHSIEGVKAFEEYCHRVAG